LPLEARRVVAEREEGGPGGSLEGVGKREGLGEVCKESDIVGGGRDGKEREEELCIGRDGLKSSVR